MRQWIGQGEGVAGFPRPLAVWVCGCDGFSQAVGLG